MANSTPANLQYNRKFSLLLTNGETALDLSEMHCTFRSSQQDEESPSNAVIRVFNLSQETLTKVKTEYSRVVVQAGYVDGPFGVIFDGTIKQFRIGREPDALNNYLDILAADGDLAYNFALVNKSLAAGTTSGDRIAAAVAAMSPLGVNAGQLLIPSSGGILPRGKVLFGMAKAILRSEVQTMGATWSIQDGKVNVIPLEGYLPGEAVVLTSQTGLIGRPEQTIQGIKCKALLNPKIIVGGLIKIDNASINQTQAQITEALPGNAGQLAYDKWAAIQQFATVTDDGTYRVYVAEYVGDTRGIDWYVEMICLTVDPVTNQCKRYG